MQEHNDSIKPNQPNRKLSTGVDLHSKNVGSQTECVFCNVLALGFPLLVRDSDFPMEALLALPFWVLVLIGPNNGLIIT